MELPAIVQAGHPILRAAAAPVRNDQLGTSHLRSLVSTMVAVMRAAPGVGLAAPQIGVDLRVIVLEDRKDLMERLPPEDCDARGRVPFPLTAICNPVLTVRPVGEGTPPHAMFFEGCLSVTGYMALVARHFAVEVTGVDPEGAPVRLDVTGWPARILQHEVDHLNGILYVDRMITRSLTSNAEAQRWILMPEAELRAALGI